jgi:hypothetical protein
MAVIIGVDPHKATHTAVAISGDGQELARKKVRSGGAQTEHLLAWAEPFAPRTWAIESAGGPSGRVSRCASRAADALDDCNRAGAVAVTRLLLVDLQPWPH